MGFKADIEKVYDMLWKMYVEEECDIHEHDLIIKMLNDIDKIMER